MKTLPTLVTAAALALPAGTVFAQQPSYDGHYLDSAEYFIANQPLSQAYQYVAVARMLVGPTETSRGEAQFLVVGASSGIGFTIGQRVWTRNFWLTRVATTQDAALGTVVFCLNKREGGVYNAPYSREEALNTGWWMTTITDLSNLFRQEVNAGAYRLSLNCLRVNAAQQQTAAAAPAGPAQFDGHYLDSAEYFIANQPLSRADQYVAVARMLVGPTETSRGEAQFLVVGASSGFTVGQRVWTRNYWRTRVATVQDAALGTVVFCLNKRVGGVYNPPDNREEALNGGWWMTTITDLSNLFRQEVNAGTYRLGLGCLRVGR